MKIIAFYSLKGGVGKTAAAVNIAYLASQAGIRTLLWDLDPQGAASWYLAGTDDIKGRKLAALMDGKTPIGKFIRDSGYPNLDFIPAHNSFRNLDVRLDKDDSNNTLKNWLAPLSEETSLVVLDCPPSMSRLSEQVLKTADGVFVPVVPTWLALNSWHQLQAFAKDKKLKPGRLHPFFSMVDRRKNLHRDMVINRKQHLEGGLNAIVPNASVVEKMGERGQPVELIDHASAAAGAYRRLWKEIRKLL
ncbi:chromosome partitioning protein [Marinobacter vulgaris]|uniref:Chromosome partitioning protein n=1 Tax=Marinobacter vulgaris TaxID=1928331 RepID=A0A2V3ZNW6_9GAMM|nr:ParA family protein [Marinobacter vulgaris]PXX92656.1 chromosome partitioning protein [Marinobacter vulgaris]TSJ71400.1 ParA family protein [Marinobacter vulgaris]